MAKSDAGLKETPSQTAGPYIHIGMDPETAGLDPARIAALTSADGQAQANGQRIRITPHGKAVEGARLGQIAFGLRQQRIRASQARLTGHP